MLLRPRRIPHGFEVRNSVSDADTGKVVRVFIGWWPIALACALAWYLQHRGDLAYQ